eukprot:3885025-Amphidinium_carterae.1
MNSTSLVLCGSGNLMAESVQSLAKARPMFPTSFNLPSVACFRCCSKLVREEKAKDGVEWSKMSDLARVRNATQP